jgi:dATP pyrophosphohydrolase
MIECDRAPFQVLVFPYRYVNDQIEYAMFKRMPTSGSLWQAIAGGGTVGEAVIDAASREAYEEAGIPLDSKYMALESMATIPVPGILDTFYWGKDVLVVPEYSFGVLIQDHEIVLSTEHEEYRWVWYDEAMKLLKWDSNRVALWELNHRLLNPGIRNAAE